MLVAPHPAGTAQPGLNLVEDEPGAPLPAQRLHAFQVRVAGRGHAERGGDRLQEHRSGFVVHDGVQRVEVVEGDLHEAGQVGPEGIPVGGISRRQRQARVAVVAAAGRHDLAAAGDAAAGLDGQIDGLPAGHPEDHPGQPPSGSGRQARRHRGAVPRNEVMVTDVPLVQRRPHCGGHARMAVAQVEHAAVAVTVEVALAGKGVGEGGPFPLPHHQPHTELPVEGDLAGRYVVGERFERLLDTGVGLSGHRRLPLRIALPAYGKRGARRGRDCVPPRVGTTWRSGSSKSRSPSSPGHRAASVGQRHRHWRRPVRV